MDFIVGDEYDVQLFVPTLINPICTTTNNVNVTFKRFVPSLQLFQPAQETVQVPTIFLTSQTLIDGSDMGDIIFTIGDEFTYYSHIPLKGTTCDNYFLLPDQIQNTIYRQYCPKMVSVIKG